MKIAAIQHDIVWEDPDANFERLRPRIEAAAADGAGLVVLSEMWSTGFSMKSQEIAEAPDGPTATFMHAVAEESGAWIAGSFPEHTTGHELPTNRLLLAGPSGEDHRYSKVHPFSYAGEDEHYSPGPGTITVDIDGLRVTPLICYDLRFTDLFWDNAATTDLFVVPANWPAARRDHWTVLLRARAIENQAYVVGVNRVGTAGRLDYTGDSVIIDPLGEQIKAPPGEEAVITGDVDVERVVEVRSDFPFMQDR